MDRDATDSGFRLGSGYVEIPDTILPLYVVRPQFADFPLPHPREQSHSHNSGPCGGQCMLVRVALELRAVEKLVQFLDCERQPRDFRLPGLRSRKIRERILAIDNSPLASPAEKSLEGGLMAPAKPSGTPPTR